MLSPRPSAEEVADHLYATSVHLLRLVRREDTATDLTGARLSALSVVVADGPLTVGDLAAAEQVRSPTASKVVAELEEWGLVTRLPSPADRRVTEVRPTPKGRWVLQAARRRRVAGLAARLNGLGDDDLGLLDRAAGVLDAMLRRPLAEEDRPTWPG